MEPDDLVLRFIGAINRHAGDDIAALLTDDHLFIDSLGVEVSGRDAMRRGWAAYFSMVPDYTIEAVQTLSAGDTVVVIGTATGSYSPGGAPLAEDRWSMPAAWRAVVKGDRIAVWQVFADNEPIRRLMRKHGRDPG